MAQRILILSASVGAGHLRAAQAVELAARQLLPDASIENIDVLELTNAAFRRMYSKAYIDLVNHAPHVLGYMYDMLDRPSRSGKHRGDRLRLAFEKLNLSKFVDLLCKRPPDLAINTHFLPASIIAHLRKERKCQFPHVTVTTDFEVHRMWVNQPCDHYFTATDDGAAGLAAWGVERDHITPTGIPIHPVFSEPKDRAALHGKHGTSGELPVVLQLAGGFGVGPIAQIHQAIIEVEQPMQLIVVTGRNAEAREQLAAMPRSPRHRVQVLGFTDQMDELMALANVVVSKPGGLTTSETLARGAAMLIVDPIPGQESRNSDFLLENGAAIKANSLPSVTYKLNRLLADPARLAQLRANALRLGRPRAAYDVVQRSMQVAAAVAKVG